MYRQPKYRWISRVGFRERNLENGWHPRGAFGSKLIGGQEVRQTIVKERKDAYLCCFHRHNDIWNDISAKTALEVEADVQ